MVYNNFHKKYQVEIFEGTIHINPPKSKNPWEYWDCVRYHTGQAMQESGRGVSVHLKYVVIGSEDDE